jgi:hypothetical protein
MASLTTRQTPHPHPKPSRAHEKAYQRRRGGEDACWSALLRFTGNAHTDPEITGDFRRVRRVALLPLLSSYFITREAMERNLLMRLS